MTENTFSGSFDDEDQPTVGIGDAAADRAASGADDDPNEPEAGGLIGRTTPHETDGQPVGADDAEADAERSGADRA
jgi:hypothetical protein